jgi:hypothetical protein
VIVICGQKEKFGGFHCGRGFALRVSFRVGCLLFAVPTPAADMKVADEPQPLLTTADGYWCVARS